MIDCYTFEYFQLIIDLFTLQSSGKLDILHEFFWFSNWKYSKCNRLSLSHLKKVSIQICTKYYYNRIWFEYCRFRILSNSSMVIAFAFDATYLYYSAKSIWFIALTFGLSSLNYISTGFSKNLMYPQDIKVSFITIPFDDIIIELIVFLRL